MFDFLAHFILCLEKKINLTSALSKLPEPANIHLSLSLYDRKYCFDLKCWYLFLNNTCCQIEKIQKALFASAVPVKRFHQL